MEQKKYTLDVGGRTLEAEFGLLANQASGSATIRYGETVVLATATMSKQRREGMDYFPLMVDYEERYYAGGKIKGSRFIKREGRPSDKAVLNGRIIDRTIRPLFDERMRNEVQVIITVLSIDKENDPVIASIIGASLALGISNIPWNGPVGAVRMGKDESGFVINPVNGVLEKSPLDLVISGTANKINMIEASANEVSNEEMQRAVAKAFEEVRKISEFEKKIISEIGIEKDQVELTTPSDEFSKIINSFLEENKLEDAFYTKDKKEQYDKMEGIKEKMVRMIDEKYAEEEEEQRRAEALYSTVMQRLFL